MDPIERLDVGGGELQVKLLRVLESGRFLRVGGKREIEGGSAVHGHERRPVIDFCSHVR